MRKNEFGFDLDGLFDEFENELEKDVKSQFVGEVIECECPICNRETECKILEIDKAICLNCNNALQLKLTIEK
ncbi:hypothetical protein [Romboutsia sp. 1001713B170131_170501_G6]|uniref:hypothetical protein n=1 Tax=Romboutsia sp. 1001713B170131_170501_G6 TaxID=2787108 RepID=UPI0018AB6F84|nr:hypothetical protein [Romboutsia sp. 1001713B170131_170501_G6]